jgi:hypothetical protein
LNYPKYRNALREWLAGQPGIVHFHVVARDFHDDVQPGG